MPWNTEKTTLQYDADDSTTAEGYYQIKGFSLTSTEYHTAEFNNSGWYDFGWDMYIGDTGYYTSYANTTPGNPGNAGLTLNVYYLMENIFKKFTPSGDGSLENPFTAPCIRIPLCADMWLNGSAQQTSLSSNESPYFVGGQSNVNFSALAYQQAIIDIIYYCYSEWEKKENTPITFILDLHWNYASPAPLTSGSYKIPQNNTNDPPAVNVNPTITYLSNVSSEQLPLCGVCTTDGLEDNTLSFWKSVSSVFGITGDVAVSNTMANTFTSNDGELFSKNPGTVPLPSTLLKSVFFELYNEPFTDFITSTKTTYADEYNIYVNGGTGTYNGNEYTFTGMLDIYNEIRTKAENIIIVAGSDGYAFMNFNTNNTNQWGVDTSGNSIIIDTYNCFTKLRDAINQSNTFNNVMINLHPYAGLYSGAVKHPGQYDPSYYGVDDNYKSLVPIPGFGQIVAALQNKDMKNFYMKCPIICTEFGQYDLPFSTYATTPYMNTTTNYQYPEEYTAPNAKSLYTYLGPASYGTPFYNGNYVSSDGTNEALPAIIGYLKDFEEYNVSFCAWAIRPNSGGNGKVTNYPSPYSAQSWMISNNNIYYTQWIQDTNAWAAFQPDITSGCWCAPPTVNGSADGAEYPASPPSTSQSANPAYQLELVGDENGQDISSDTINFGCQGADFVYIFNNHYI